MKNIILLLLPLITTAQNLIKNGNFEKTPINNIKIIVNEGKVFSNEPIAGYYCDESTNYLKNWGVISQFNQYFSYYYDYRIENEIAKHKICSELIKPKENVCARSTDYNHINIFYTKLVQATEISKEYIINLDYLIASKDKIFLEKFKAGNFSIIFSSRKFTINAIKNIETDSYIIPINTDSDTLLNWNNYSEKIVFDKNYTYMYIGNIKPFSRPFFHKSVDDYCGGTGFYIDNISLIPADSMYIYKINTLKKGDVITLKNINFSVNSDILDSSSHISLNSFVDYLKSNNFNIEISGHTDNTGNYNKNIQLSKKRAQAVYNYFIAQGVSANRLSFVGYGSSKPIETNDTEEGKNKNRRVEIKIL